MLILLLCCLLSLIPDQLEVVEMPRPLVSIQQLVLEHQSLGVMRWDEFKQLIEPHIQGDLSSRVQELHRWGSLIHFGDDPIVREIVVLHSEWLTKVLVHLSTPLNHLHSF